MVTIIAAEGDGEKARALENAEGKSFVRVKLTTGPNKGDIIRVAAGNYIVNA